MNKPERCVYERKPQTGFHRSLRPFTNPEVQQWNQHILGTSQRPAAMALRFCDPPTFGSGKTKVKSESKKLVTVSIIKKPGNWSWKLCHVSLPSKLTAEQPEDLRAEPLDGPTVALPSKWEGNAHLPIISQSPRTKGKQGKLDKVDRSHDVSIRNWKDWENKSGQIDIQLHDALGNVFLSVKEEKSS